MEKCVGDRQATDYNTIRLMSFVSWITEATDAHSEYVMLTAFTDNG
jgi:hypothetical protein